MNKTQKETSIAIAVVLVAVICIGFLRQSFTPQVLASGEFHQVAHKGTGKAEIIKKRNGKYVLKLTDFETTAKPDLFVYLISASDASENETIKRSEIFSLGELQNAKGSQEYLLPDGFDFTKYGAVTIWNRRYEVNFTTAPLRKN